MNLSDDFVRKFEKVGLDGSFRRPENPKNQFFAIIETKLYIPKKQIIIGFLNYKNRN